MVARTSRCHFKNCIFNDSLVVDCHFDSCVFENCDLSNVKLKKSNFINTTFKNSKLLGINWSNVTSPFQPFFMSSNLDYCVFSNHSMTNLKLESCSAKYSFFQNCDLSNAVITENNFEDAKLANPSENEALKISSIE